MSSMRFFTRHLQPLEQLQTIVDRRQLLGRDHVEHTQDPAFVDRAQLIDQRPRRFDEARCTRSQPGVQGAFAGSARERDDRQHRKPLILGDCWIGHDDTRSGPALLVTDRGIQRDQDDGSAVHSDSSRQPPSASWRKWTSASITFDVDEIETDTLAFGSGGAALAHARGPHPSDLNEDGWKDLLGHYRTQASGISATDEMACLRWHLSDGTPYESCDRLATQLREAGARRAVHD